VMPCICQQKVPIGTIDIVRWRNVSGIDRYSWIL
jgi:hypothetical protein